jgi:hypothetical protein
MRQMRVTMPTELTSVSGRPDASRARRGRRGPARRDRKRAVGSCGQVPGNRRQPWSRGEGKRG